MAKPVTSCPLPAPPSPRGPACLSRRRRRSRGRLRALPSAQAQSGGQAGKRGGPERCRAAPSLGVPGGVSVQPCLAARGGEEGSVGGALCEAAADEWRRRAFMSAARD